MSSHAAFLQVWLHPLKPYERHISAAAMVGGFGFDNVTYGRVDHPVTQTLLIVYLGVVAVAIVVLHWLEAHQNWQSWTVVKLRAFLPALTQFMFGSLWSAFLVFYWRSGVVAASWPFLIVLSAILLGNEFLKKYNARLVFTTTLFFFALISYAAFMVPVFVHRIGMPVFLLSGAASVAVFAGFLWVLNKFSGGKLGEIRRQIAAGGIGVYAVITGLYFLNVLPPLPLAMANSGVYQSLCAVPVNRPVHCFGAPVAPVARAGGLYYRAMQEPALWTNLFGIPRVTHVEPGAPVIVFGAVFAPINLDTTIYHVWQYYDSAAGEWRTVQTIAKVLRGGRGKGYRDYSLKTNPAPGLWRVDFKTNDGRTIGRTEFTIENGQPASLQAVTL